MPINTQLKQLALDYISDNPNAKDEINKAGYAFHCDDWWNINDAHRFTNGSRSSSCIWCKRTRDKVRYDSLPAHCLHRPSEIKPIASVIFDGEQRAHDLLNKSSQIIEKVIKKHGVSGKSLFILHGTYGIDAETTASVIDIPDNILNEFHQVLLDQQKSDRLKTKEKQIII
jgi:hypothetical protein